MPNPRRPFAIADIGSNTVKMTVHTCDGDKPVTIHHESDTVRIGHGVSRTGRISDDRISRLLSCLRRMETVARHHGAETFIAVATQAFRQAENGEQVGDTLVANTSWQIRIISGDDETLFTLEGARPFLEDGRQTTIADVGGASTEIVVASPSGAMIAGGSVPVGSGLLFDDRIKDCPPPAGTLELARADAAIRFRESGLLPSDTDLLLLPGGTGNLLRKLLATLDPDASLNRTGLDRLHGWLESDNGNATATRLDIQIERAHVLPASLAVVESLTDMLAPQETRAIPSGVGRGIAQLVCEGQWSAPK